MQKKLFSYTPLVEDIKFICNSIQTPAEPAVFVMATLKKRETIKKNASVFVAIVLNVDGHRPTVANILFFFVSHSRIRFHFSEDESELLVWSGLHDSTSAHFL